MTPQGRASGSGEADPARVLGESIVSGLRNYFPGLNIFLESLCEVKYGCSLRDLIIRDIVEFCKLLDEHFSSRETTYRILRFILKPVLQGCGEEVLDELFRGNPDPLFSQVTMVLRRRGTI